MSDDEETSVISSSEQQQSQYNEQEQQTYVGNGMSGGRSMVSVTIDRYLYGEGGAPSSQPPAAAAAPESPPPPRSKSHDILSSSSSASSSTLHRRTKTERGGGGMRIQHHIHQLIDSHGARRQHEKDELGELNSRLDKLVSAIRHKKSQNDDLEACIRRERDAMLEVAGTRALRSHVDALDEAKRELNDVSEQSSVAKIRASRSMHDLHVMRATLDDECKYESARRERISALDAQRARSSHELTHLRASWQSVERSLSDESRRQAALRSQLDEINDRLDAEQEARMQLEHRIQVSDFLVFFSFSFSFLIFLHFKITAYRRCSRPRSSTRR